MRKQYDPDHIRGEIIRLLMQDGVIDVKSLRVMPSEHSYSIKRMLHKMKEEGILEEFRVVIGKRIRRLFRLSNYRRNRIEYIADIEEEYIEQYTKYATIIATDINRRNSDKPARIISHLECNMIMREAEINIVYPDKSTSLSNLNSRHRYKMSGVQVTREYPDWHMETVESSNSDKLLADMLRVEEEWLSEQEEISESVLIEKEEIREAISLWAELPLSGAVIYVADKPVAMTIASEISEGAFDILFEKSYGEYAQAGGFAAINKYFADYLRKSHDAHWINREEDVGLPGLRRAKMAYHPDIRLEKYEVTLN